MSSSSSTDEGPDGLIGSVIAGFRLDALIGGHCGVAVYAATQLDLERAVALKLIPADRLPEAGLRRLPWPDHPNAVALYAAGSTQHGGFLAMKRVRAPTLSAALRSGGLRPDTARAVLAGVAAALDSLHRERRAHGAVHAGNVFADGERGLLTDFGLGPAKATAAGDREAFAALVREVLGTATPGPPPATALAILGVPGSPSRLRRWWWPVAAAVAVLAVVAAAALSFSSSGVADERPPLALAGAVVLGSALAAQHEDSVDCNGLPPTGSSEACTIVQTRLGAARLVPDRGGVIRRWAVRGARGELALQVLRRRGGRYFLVARTPYVRIPDDGLHVMPANLPVRDGDLVGLEVTPGAAIGVSDARNAETARWLGPIVLTVRPAEPHGPPIDRELLLRVEYVPGARWRSPGELTGGAAAAAPAGELVTRLRVDPRLRLELRSTENGVAVDLVKRSRRVVRATVAGAEPGGRLLVFEVTSVRFGKPILRVRWQNPGGEVGHDYVVNTRSIVPLS
jgi:hypothetical protein